MAQVYKFLLSPETVAALKSQSAGTATKTETDLIAAAARNVKIPTGVGTLVKGAGAAGVAYTGWQVGTFMGAGAAGGITQTLWGVDANNLVCSAATGTAQGFLSFFAGQKCADFNAAQGLVINADAKSGLSMGPSCPTSGAMAGWCGALGAKVDLGAQGATWCMHVTKTGGTPTGYSSVDYAYKWGPADWQYSSASGNLRENDSRWECAAKAGAITVAISTSATETLYGFRLGNEGGQAFSPVQNTSGNPSRWLECTTTGSKGTTVAGRGGSFTETDADWNGAVPKDCGTLPAGEVPTGTKVDLVTDGADKRTLLDQPVPAKTVDEMTGKYQTCLQTVCQLILEKNGVSCFDGADCTGWFADAATGTSTNTYTCKYAGQAVDLGECTVYKPSWEPDAIASGQLLADPVTGTPQKNSPNPTEQAAGPVKGADAGAFGTPVQDPSKARECFPTGWGVLNPLNWVLQPAKCALEWAFVPRASAMDDAFGQMSAGTARTALGGIGGLLAGFGSLSVAQGGCQGPPLTFNAFGISETSYPFSACAEPMAGVAATTKTLGAGVILLVSTMACTRYISGIIGFTAFGLASSGGDSDDVTVNMRTGEVKG